ncbi:MAG: hypothetical protein Q7T32_06840 [Moraxellaceae bacterium]|nr:hypothetical protein [Moraxellaceae bacterium]
MPAVRYRQSLLLVIARVSMPLDAIRSLGAKMYLNKYFEDFGEVIEVEVEPKSNMATMLVQLKGEAAPLWLKVDYRVEPDAFVVVHFRCEREWVGNALNRFLGGKRFDISSGFTQTVLNLLL